MSEGTGRTRLFISHASEDKESFVRPLVDNLIEFGIDAWFDELTIGVGDSILRSIDQGMRQCEFGVLVLSESFLAKPWTEYEFTSLMTRAVTSREKMLVPIWLDVTREEVAKFSLALADLKAIQASGRTLRVVTRELLSRVDPASLATFRAAEHLEGGGGKSQRMRLGDINFISPAVPLSMPGHDAVRAVLAESAFPMRGEVDLDGMFAGLSKDMHYTKELVVHEILAATYLLTRSETELDEETSRELVYFLLLISVGSFEVAEQVELPEEVKQTSLRYLREMNRISRLPQVTVTSSQVDPDVGDDVGPRLAALKTLFFSGENESLIRQLDRLTEEAHLVGKNGDAAAAARSFAELQANAVEIEGFPGKYDSWVRGNYAYWLGMSGEFEKAIAIFRELAKSRVGVFGQYGDPTLSARSNLADFLGRSGDWGEACLEWEKLLDDATREMGADSARADQARNGLAHDLLPWMEELTAIGPTNGHAEIVTRMMGKAFFSRRAQSPTSPPSESEPWQAKLFE